MKEGRNMADREQRWRQNISSGSAYEQQVGYSRAVRVGNQIFVAGTTALEDGNVVGKDDPAAQTRRILEIIGQALDQAGASIADVVRYRTFVTNVDDWHAIASELVKVFGDVRPANTLVEVSKLIDPDMRVEIEVDAVLSPARGLDPGFTPRITDKGLHGTPL
jgi:enamine deaminase RidA (YjgF/YER057c/UK114 family)